MRHRGERKPIADVCESSHGYSDERVRYCRPYIGPNRSQFMRVFRVAVACLVILCSAVVAEAQTCPQFTPPYGYIVFSGSCGVYGNICNPASAITFSYTPYGSLESCDTITWSWGDGTPDLPAGTAPVTHTYANPGTYLVRATVANSKGSVYELLSMNVGYGYVTFSNTFPTVKENVGTASITVTRSASTGTASVAYATADLSAHAGVDYTAVSGTLTFNPGEPPKTISVPIIDNTVFTGNTSSFNVILSSLTTGWLFDNFAATKIGTITIADDEQPPTFGFSQANYDVREDAGTATITVNRTGDLTTTTSVYWTVYSSPNYSNGTLIFGPNETSHTFTVAIPNDSVYTGTRTWSMYLNGWALSRGNATLTITDDEPQPEIIVDDVSIAEGDSGQKEVTFNIHLNGALSSQTY